MFNVYTILPSTAINLPELIQTLNRGVFGNFTGGDQWAPASPSPPPIPDDDSNPITAIIHHHRNLPTNDSSINRTYFVIADRPDGRTQGILAITLNFEAFIDAARMLPHVAGSAIPSVSIANTDWDEALVSHPTTKALYPFGKFAVYAIPFADGATAEKALLESLNGGLESRKADVKPGVCLLAPLRRGDVEGIAREHGRLVKEDVEGGFDPEYFVVVDDGEWEDKGVEIVRVQVQGEGTDGLEWDSCVRPVDVAAEVLTWVSVGMMTWEEAKVWDEDPLEEE